MLSRENVIHRSAGEEQRERASRADTRHAPGGADGEAFLKGKIWGETALLVLILGLLAAFVVLNRGAVVEPRADLLFWSFERPSLLLITLLTSVPSAAAALLARAAFDTRRQRRDVPARTLLAPPQLRPVPTEEPAAATVAS